MAYIGGVFFGYRYLYPILGVSYDNQSAYTAPTNEDIFGTVVLRLFYGTQYAVPYQ